MAVNYSLDQTLGIMNNLGNSLKETYDIVGAEKAFKAAMDLSGGCLPFISSYHIVSSTR